MVYKIVIGVIAIWYALVFGKCAYKLFKLWEIQAHTFIVCCTIIAVISMALWLVGIAYKQIKRRD